MKSYELLIAFQRYYAAGCKPYYWVVHDMFVIVRVKIPHSVRNNGKLVTSPTSSEIYQNSFERIEDMAFVLFEKSRKPPVLVFLFWCDLVVLHFKYIIELIGYFRYRKQAFLLYYIFYPLGLLMIQQIELLVNFCNVQLCIRHVVPIIFVHPWY